MKSGIFGGAETLHRMELKSRLLQGTASYKMVDFKHRMNTISLTGFHP